MNPHEQPPLDPQEEPPIDPLVSRAQLYRTLNQLWIFPSFGAILILGNSAVKGSLQEMIDSQRIEDIAATAILIAHLFLCLQSKRYHQLKQSHEGASLTH